ncbi:MAG: flagellar hook-length control protein FliK [Methylobacterium sp.]|nr:MAG: flagellar hook-length control protein FliK [Methylobacterium sp.]
MTIGLRSLAGSSEFQIRLDPLELGRVDVTLDIDRDKGTVTTHLVVERVETLAMLQRDAGSLQQALAQAGLDPSQGGITMSLRSDGGSGGESAQRDDRPGRGGALANTPSEAAVAEIVPMRTLRGLSGLDIRI